MQSAPPIRALAPVFLALLLGAAHLIGPAFHGPQELPTWRLAFGLVSLTAFLALFVWLARAPVFQVDGDSILVRQLFVPARRLPLSQVSSVGAVGRGVFGQTVLEVDFKNGESLVVPRCYSNFSSVGRLMFSQLGANIQSSKNVA